MKKIESTRKIIVNSEIRIYRKGFGYSKLTVIENNDYYIAALADDDLFNYIRDGDTVEAYLWVENVASYEFILQVIGRITAGQRILFFEHTESIMRSAERKCLIASVDIPIKFFTFDPGVSARNLSSEQIVFHTGTVILLSDREATVRCDADMSGSKFLKGHITIDGEIIELVGSIDPVNKPKMIYNVLFSGMHDKERNRILGYIFSIYRE